MTSRSSRNVVLALAVGLVAAMLALPSTRQAVAQPTPARPRIGVYESRAISLAYARSGAGMAARKNVMDDLQEQLADAKTANDAKKVAEIKARGATMQTLANIQVFSNAPADEALAVIHDKLPAVAKDAGVSVITSRLDFQGDDVDVVDVTDKLVAEFKPDPRTLTTINELRKRKPITLLEALSIKE